MSASPQYSPDGRWYWDGQRWQPVVAPGPLWSRPYAPPESRASAAIGLVVAAMAGAGLFFIGEALDLVAVLVLPDPLVEFVAQTADLIAAIGSIAGTVGAAIAVPMWMHRTYRNLPSLGATNLRWSPGWAAGSWFIPFVNLVLPYLVTRELWGATDPPRPAFPLLEAWWVAWIGSAIVQIVANQVGRFSLAGGDVLGIVNDAGVLVAGVLLIMIIQAVTRRQRARHAELASANA
jgi:hypothetical protein